MLGALRLIAALLIMLAAGAVLASDAKPYAREDMASDAVRLTETLRIEAGRIGAETAGKTPNDLRKAANAAAVAGSFDAAQQLAAAAIAAAPKDPANWLAYAGVAIWADDAKADGRGSSSPGGRPRPTPPTSIPPRLTRRPRRWPRSATFSPATKSGAARSTP